MDPTTDLKLKWPEGCIKVKKLRRHHLIKEWCAKDEAVYNWLYTSLVVFAISKKVTLNIPIPEQFQEILGKEAEFMRFDDHEIHVML